MFHRLFTGKSQGYPQVFKTLETLSDHIQALTDRVRALELACKSNQEDIEHVDIALNKLRGRVTGGIRHAKTDIEAAPGDRAALRRLAGISPGRPYPHT